MRTVSFFGAEGGGTGGGRTEAGDGPLAGGGFGGGKKLVDEISSGADCGEEGTGGLPVSRTGNWIRTVSRGLTVCWGGFCCGGFGGGGTGTWMRTVSFFGWSGSAIRVGPIDQKTADLSLPNVWTLGKCVSR
jgi:hypothetical protein